MHWIELLQNQLTPILPTLTVHLISPRHPTQYKVHRNALRNFLCRFVICNNCNQTKLLEQLAITITQCNYSLLKRVCKLLLQFSCLLYNYQDQYFTKMYSFRNPHFFFKSSTCVATLLTSLNPTLMCSLCSVVL